MQTETWRAPSPYIMSLQVTADMIDDFGHVNNVVYLGWMARSAWAHSKALGFDFAAYQKVDCGFVVRHHDIDYLAACFKDDQIDIATWISRNDGRLYLRRRFEMKRAQTGETVALGMSDFVTMRLSTGKACRMPEVFKLGYPEMPSVEERFS